MQPEISIVITKDGWTETLKVDGKEYVKTYSRNLAGIRRNNIGWEDDPTVPGMAYPTFNELTAACEDAMFVLYANTDSSKSENSKKPVA